ncbi:hypothetical protein QAD02_013833 [Eretmocerus hayati]|uniref:Uncharacterized protein n=1 Tax=Eretmocerus hayati TaxID=131215 RepID=A0ACC2P4P9_9HYME|nr:hypothetical protein QAD02_013833 [Eretmocerus hayati]
MSKAEILLGFSTFSLVFTLPQDGFVELLKLVNICFGLNFLPATRYLIDKLFMNHDGMVYHACCPHCGRYNSQFDKSTITLRCRHCNRITRVKHPMYRDSSAILDVRPEVATLIKSNWGFYRDAVRRNGDPAMISDITDGILYRRFVNPLPQHLRLSYATCVFDTDGVPAFSNRSTTRSGPANLLRMNYPLL